jgi:hypothetical protein
MSDLPSDQEITKLAALADDSHKDAFLAELSSIHPKSTEDMKATLMAIAQKRGEIAGQGEGIGVLDRTNVAGGDFRLVGQHTHIIIPALSPKGN